MTAPRGAARHYVLHDRSVPACLRVSRALHLPLWGRGSTPLQEDEQLVVVLSRASQARHVLAAVRHGQRPPALVVGWGLPERQVAALLGAGVPTVDGSVIDDPSSADTALHGGWDQGRFTEERELAEVLAEMEFHLVEAQEAVE